MLKKWLQKPAAGPENAEPQMNSAFDSTLLKESGKPAGKRAVDDDGQREPRKAVKVAAAIVELNFAGDWDSLENETIGASWLPLVQGEFDKPYFKKLKTFLKNEHDKKKTIFPPLPDIYSWSRFCTFDQVKVVIIGQDPYHNHHQAHGLCFSVRKDIAIPPSLVNIYKELAADIPGFNNPGHGYLAKWAEQGVLLLNAVLTVEAHKANSHAGKGWEQFTDALIRLIAKHCENVVFMLWGNYAHKKATGIDGKRHLLLKSVHPSPLSAHRGYFGCKHFSKANQYLEEHGKAPIDWKLVSE